METALIVANQTLVMFLYMLLGFFLKRTGRLTAQGSKDIATLLAQIIIPAVVIKSFCVECTAEKLISFGESALLGAVALIVSMVISRLLFGKNPIDQFASAFSNAGFMAIPLVEASLGSEAVFSLVGMTAFLNILQWTYGENLLTGKKSSVSVKGILLNPIVIGSIIGFVLFVTGIGAHLPKALQTAINGTASLNAPLAMIVLGVYLADADIKAMISTPKLYWLSAVRLFLIPAVTVLCFKLLPFSEAMKLAVIVAAAAPAGVNVAVCAQVNDLDYSYACQGVVLSTLFSIVSMPLIILLAQQL